MALPFFYIETFDATQQLITLNEETSKHVVQVLRMQVGEQLNLTDGKGSMLTAAISDAHKKHCVVQVKAVSYQPQAARKITIAVSLVKNASRFEWFLEKATEIGVTEIIPLLCERTERQHFRYDRMKGIVVSAMLQSQQRWLSLLHEPMKFENALRLTPSSDGILKLIAHCEETERNSLNKILSEAEGSNCIILIGPEGDFTNEEINLAIAAEFKPVMLGETRLRTETAGVVAAALLCIA
ncbi:RsmE family RNA methyltransferase [Lacibacter sediminis]|uniref:Ribosomal RNA small subunit methyltransferase E n=1 Tax=Lacibacter sediminis TaxID=2760713 RepID=A0A7G5XE86_9BACT|nr:RsmE family RNA methyltransferase [Lacibacter sediminis]QNA43789.1 16S rRNA (uracil(1498)-N(3))-methyltransferase [Lacibacter sediminis]